MHCPAHVKTTYLPPYRLLLERLAASREGVGFTQGELGTRLGKPQSYISKVESGERRLDLVEYVYWSKALGLDPAELVVALAEAIELPQQPKPRKRIPT
jgi:transcriptional regulator with XRE-family HTH domain